VLLNIWATWCLPCRKEMPTLDRLQAQLGGPDFEVVAVSIDRKGAEAVRKFFADIGVTHRLSAP
jgi:thiol-disulfide isomerase/thioredoxin